MSIKTTNLPGEPILIISMVQPLKTSDEADVNQASAEFKNAEGQHIYRILDFKSLGGDVPFSEMMSGMAQGLNAEGGVNDPDVSTIVVGSTEWVVFGAKAIQDQAQYGQTNVVHLCGSVDEGIEFARAAIKRK